MLFFPVKKSKVKTIIYRGHIKDFRVWIMVFSTTFNNISVLSWRSVLLVEQTGLPGEDHRPVACQ
jgi:uncharacterized DUF497 family protein